MTDGGSRKSSLAALWKGNNVFLINLVCPDNSTLTKVHNVKESVQDVINNSCKSLFIKATEIFGLAIYENNEYCFISPKKSLGKVLPSSTIVTSEEAAKLNDSNYLVLDSSTIKTCRLYLRIKHFYVNVDILEGQLLHYYYEQVRFDTIKQQNWLNLFGYTEVFYNIASRSLWLTYGPEITHQFEVKEVNLHYHLPQCQWEEDTGKILGEKLLRLHDDLKSDDDHDCDVFNTKPRDQDHSYIMLSVLKEALKLPFYGMHYYHVTFIRDEPLPPICCKLGIGPFGITTNVSTDYTTWEECDSWNWSTVGDIKREKNMLHIHESVNGTNTDVVHIFRCIDDNEARYLLTELQETYAFQMTILDRYKRLKPDSTKKKSRNTSIGVLSSESTSLFLSPLISRSTSLTILKNPRRQSIDFGKHQKDKADLTLVSFRKSSCM